MKPQTKAERERAAKLAKERNPKYPSGNEGRTHPGLKHDGYFSGIKTPLSRQEDRDGD